MKKICILIMLLLVFSGCGNSATEKEISSLEDQLKIVSNASEEKEIIEKLWNIANDDTEISLNVGATDSKGNQVINNLSEAIEPISVTIRFHESSWNKEIKFEPLDIKNVYILLQE